MDADAKQDTEWRLLYAKLSALLESAGEPDPYGEGDYWIALALKDKRYTGGPEGMVVTSQGVREHWDRRLLKEQLGYEYS